MSGRKVELDEVTIPAPLLESSPSQKPVPVTPTPISEEANDDDHETSDQVTTKLRRSTRVRSAPEWYSNPVLEVMLLDHDEPDKLEPKSEKCVFIGYPKETVGYTFYHISEGKISFAKNGSFLEKEFISKEMSGRKVELDEIIVPAHLLESSSSQKSVLVIPTPVSEEINDDDHETSDQVTTEPHRSTRVRSALEW